MNTMQHQRDTEAQIIRKIRLNIYRQPLTQTELIHRFKIAAAALAFVVLIGFLLVAGCQDAYAEISESQAVTCILGEARGEGYASMLAHAEAIRNRGTLKGVYGCRVDFSKEIPYLKAMGIIKEAVMAWEQSQWTKTVKGADHWGSLKVDGAWIARMKRAGYVRTAVVNNTAFYRKGA